MRAFNTSYAEDLTVSARYRCFIPSSCSAPTDSVQFTLMPRESRAFNDIVVSLFNAPDTAGGIEFEHTGGPQQLVVTSRLYSTAPTPTVGMFIPGLPNSDESPTTVLTSIRNRGPDAGFRTNVGLFNHEDAPVNVTFTIFDGGIQIGNPVTRSVGGHSGAQVSDIFEAAGQTDHATQNAVVVVSATGPVFSYAAVIDNHTTDPIFVVGAEDEPPQPITPVVTVTPSGATATRTADTNSDRHADVSGRRAYGQRRAGRLELRRPGQRHEHDDDHRRHRGELGLGRGFPLDDEDFTSRAVGLRQPPPAFQLSAHLQPGGDIHLRLRRARRRHERHRHREPLGPELSLAGRERRHAPRSKRAGAPRAR